MILFELKLNGRARSKKNSKQIWRGKNGKPFITSSDLYKKWAFYASFFVKKEKAKIKTIDYPCNLSVKCYYIDHKHEQDLENIISSVSDLLEDCEVIKNDKLFYSYDGSCKIFNSDSEFVEIKISKL